MVVRDLKRLGEMDCVLFGIGLSDAEFDASKVVPGAKGWKLVVDGDGLRRMKEGPGIPAGCILTPHEGEFRMLFGLEGTPENVRAMAAGCRCVILKKGAVDVIADGRSGDASRCIVSKNTVHNQGMTRGGTGDVLAGLVAALSCKNDAFIAAKAGAMINGHAGNRLVKRYGYNFCASDLAQSLAESCAELYGG